MVDSRVVDNLNMHKSLLILGHRNWGDAYLICSSKELLLKNILLNGHFYYLKEWLLGDVGKVIVFKLQQSFANC
jgi:hypothetical protein